MHRPSQPQEVTIRPVERIARACFLRSAFVALPLAGCSAAPPPPVAVSVEAPPRPPPEPPARWVRTGGATSFGVPWNDDRVVLLGGRRAILARDGTLRPELAPLPEPLEELFLVPTAGGPRLAASGPSRSSRSPRRWAHPRSSSSAPPEAPRPRAAASGSARAKAAAHR